MRSLPSTVPLIKALRISRLHDAETELAETIHSNTDAGALLFALRDPAPLDLATVNAIASAPMASVSSDSRFELALAWVHPDVPVTVHFYMNERSIPAGHGTVRGGRAFFAIPDDMVVAPHDLTVALRFWSGRWRYQLWGRRDDQRFLVDSGSDPDPASTDDDLVLKTVAFGAP